MKCPKCGVDNPEHVAYCGKCGHELPLHTHSQNEASLNRITQQTAESTGPTQLQALIATAINTRRIALVLILAVFVSAISTLFGLWLSVLEPEPRRGETVIMIWLVIASLVMIVGLFFIVSSKRLTRL